MLTIITVDTNIWVSTFLTPHGHAARIQKYWQANPFDVLISPQLLAELAEVLERPRLQNKYHYTSEEVVAYLYLINELALPVNINRTLNLCRDSDDDMLLETALAGNATHIISRDEDITRDSDLSQHSKLRNIELTTIQNFINIIAKQ